MASIKKLLLDTPLFTFGDLFQRGASFFVLPFITYFLSPEEFGRAIILITIAAFFSGFITLNIITTVIRFASDFNKKNNQALFKFFSTIIVFLLINTFLINIFFMTLFLVLNYFFKMEVLVPLLVIFLSSIITPYDTYQRILIAADKAKIYVRNQVLNFLLYTTSLFILIYLNYSFLSIIIATIISFSFFIYYLYSRLNIFLSKSLLLTK